MTADGALIGNPSMRQGNSSRNVDGRSGCGAPAQGPRVAQPGFIRQPASVLKGGWPIFRAARKAGLLAFLSKAPGVAHSESASYNQRQTCPIRASGGLLVEADDASCRIAEPGSDLGRVRADRLHDLAAMGYNRVNGRGYAVNHDVKQEAGLCCGRGFRLFFGTSCRLERTIKRVVLARKGAAVPTRSGQGRRPHKMQKQRQKKGKGGVILRLCSG